MDHPTSLTQRWLAELKASGYHLTRPRRLIVEIIATSPRALEPIEIYDQGKVNYPHLGLVTVYRTLDILVELGVLRRVHLDDGCHGYALSQASHGHYLICSSCNQVVEFDGCDLDRLFKDIARKTGFRIDGHWLQVFGHCPKCQ